jgi:hypothetical protein
MPFIDGSITASTPAAVTAASIAFPPDCNTFNPAAEASDWLVAIIPRRPTAGDLVAEMFPDGRSPGRGAGLIIMTGRRE